MKKISPVPTQVRIADDKGKPTQVMVRFLEEVRGSLLPEPPKYDGTDKTYGIKVTKGGTEWVEI